MAGLTHGLTMAGLRRKAAAASKRYAAQLKELGEMGSLDDRGVKNYRTTYFWDLLGLAANPSFLLDFHDFPLAMWKISGDCKNLKEFGTGI